MPSRIHHIAVEVSDAEKSADFYCRLLGFTRGDKFVFADRGRTIIFVQLGETCLELLQDAEYDAPVAQPKMLGFKHVCLETTEVDAEVERLRAAGVKITMEPFDTAINSRISFFEDPDGLMLELWQQK
ncbi:MAG: VOC family protein [Armatimonadota bacterium]